MNEPSNYLKNKLIDHLLRTTTFSQPSVIAIALCTDAPTDASTGATIVEVPNSNNYSRKTLNPSNSNWVGTHGTTTGASSGTDGSTSNAIIVGFDPASGSWGTITHIAVCDSATWGAGNVLFYGEAPDPVTIDNGETIAIDLNDLTFTIGACPVPAESYNCVSGDCVDPGDGTGEFATLEECQAACGFPQFVKDSRGLDFLNGFSDGNLMGSSISNVEEGSLLVVFIETTEETSLIGSHAVAFKREPATPVVFTLAGEIENNSDPPAGSLFTNKLQAYYFENAPAGDYTVTITMVATSYPASRYAVWDFVEYRNIAPTGALFAETENSGNDESPTVAAPARNSTDDLIVVAYGTRPISQDASPTLVSSGYTSRWLHDPTFQVTMGIADYHSNPSPVDAQWAIQMSGGNSPPWNAIALSFKKAP